jgi:hypothetical protein
MSRPLLNDTQRMIGRINRMLNKADVRGQDRVIVAFNILFHALQAYAEDPESQGDAEWYNVVDWLEAERDAWFDERDRDSAVAEEEAEGAA